MADEPTTTAATPPAGKKPTARKPAARKPAAAKTAKAPAAKPRAKAAAAAEPSAKTPRKPVAPRKTTAKTASTPAAKPKKSGSSFGLKTAIAAGIGTVGAVATAALLTLRGSTPKSGDTSPSGSAKTAAQADGTDSSKSFRAGIADEGSVPKS